jgi:hypothetical protein
VDQQSTDPDGGAISRGGRESWAGAAKPVKILKERTVRRGKSRAARVGRLLSPPANRSDGRVLSREYCRDTGCFSDQPRGLSLAPYEFLLVISNSVEAVLLRFDTAG